MTTQAMTTHKTGTRNEWLAARLELLKAEKELTRRGDELARRRQELPWVRIDKEYRFETDEGSASLVDLFRGLSQVLVYHFMFGSDFKAGVRPVRQSRTVQRHRRTSCQPRRYAVGGIAPAREVAGVQAANGLDLSLGIRGRRRLQLRLQRLVHGGATTHGGHRLQLPARGADERRISVARGSGGWGRLG